MPKTCQSPSGGIYRHSFSESHSWNPFFGGFVGFAEAFSVGPGKDSTEAQRKGRKSQRKAEK
jgi:hypothetical protein